MVGPFKILGEEKFKKIQGDSWDNFPFLWSSLVDFEYNS